MRLLEWVWIRYLSQRSATSEPAVLFVIRIDNSLTKAMTYCEGRNFTVILTVSSSVCRRTVRRITASLPCSPWISWWVIFFAFGFLPSPTVKLSSRVSSAISTGFCFLVALKLLSISASWLTMGVTRADLSSSPLRDILAVCIFIGSFLTKITCFWSCCIKINSNLIMNSP